MDIAEKLYQRGYLSYPRTETDKFKEGFDLQALTLPLPPTPNPNP